MGRLYGPRRKLLVSPFWSLGVPCSVFLKNVSTTPDCRNDWTSVPETNDWSWRKDLFNQCLRQSLRRYWCVKRFIKSRFTRPHQHTEYCYSRHGGRGRCRREADEPLRGVEGYRSHIGPLLPVLRVEGLSPTRDMTCPLPTSRSLVHTGFIRYYEIIHDTPPFQGSNPFKLSVTLQFTQRNDVLKSLGIVRLHGMLTDSPSVIYVVKNSVKGV